MKLFIIKYSQFPLWLYVL